MFPFKYCKFVILAIATTMNLGIAKAMPQNIDHGLAATTNSLTGCSADYDGQFGLAWVGANEFTPVSITSLWPCYNLRLASRATCLKFVYFCERSILIISQPRTMDCSASGLQTAFRGTLTEGIIRLTKGDGSAATMALKNNGAVEPLYDGEGSGDAAKTDGFAICDGGFVKMDNTEVFWGCSRIAEGVTDVMLEDEGNCRPIRQRILPCEGIEGIHISR